MGYKPRVFPEVWLSVITAVVFFPMMFMLNSQNDFDLWRFGLLFTGIITVVYGYSYFDMKRRLK